MSELNAQIKDAIDSFDTEKARELLRVAMKDANAETYFLASKVAIDDDQKQEFLQKAVELDPFHEKAHKALKQTSQPQLKMSSVSTATQTAGAATVDVDGQVYVFSDLGSRFVAMLIDYAVFWISFPVVWIIVNFFMALVNGELEYAFFDGGFLGIGSEWAEYYANEYGGTLIAILLTMVISMTNFIILPVFTFPNLPFPLGGKRQKGQTIGKAVMGIRIMPIHGNYGLLRSFGRVLSYGISSFFFYIGYLWAIFDPKRQAWHDKIVSTVVVKVRD